MLRFFRLMSSMILFLVILTDLKKVLGADQEEKSPLPKSQICLMDSSAEYTSAEWLQDFIAYTENKGRKKQKLETEVEYTSSYVRFVKDSNSLSVGYGVLKKSGRIPSLILHKEEYEKLSRLGFMVKIINGYIQNLDQEKQTFTPENTNFLVPHISYIIQWEEDQDPQLVPAGMMRNPTKNAVIILMSGGGNEDAKTKIEAAYNAVINGRPEEKIKIYSGNDMADQYLPYILGDAVRDKRIDVFQDHYLSTVADNIARRSPYTKDPKDSVFRAKNAIGLTAQALELLFKGENDKLFKDRRDTVRLLLKIEIEEESTPTIEEEEKEEKKDFKETAFKKVTKDRKNFFIKAALKRISETAQNLLEEEKSSINDLTLYLEYIAHPQLVEELDEARKFWEHIKRIGNNLTCSNPDAQSSYSSHISIAERLRKYALSGYGGSHTEQLLVKLVRTNHFLLTQSLDKLFLGKKASLAVDWRPRFLGIIIDVFSWLDTCSNCATYLHTNSDWVTILEKIRPIIEKTGFSVPFSRVDSLFRVLSQQQYGGTPSDLSSAEGGSDYTKSGWDFRLLSEERYTLSTRNPVKETLMRDRTFEKIHSSVIRAATTFSLDFWLSDPFAKFLLDSEKDRDLSENVREILYIRFPTVKSLAIRKAIEDIRQDNYESAYKILNPYVQTPFEFEEGDREGAQILIPEVLKDSQYLKSYFGKICLKRARLSFKRGDSVEGRKYVEDFSRFGMVHDQDALLRKDDETAEVHIIHYWKTKWAMGKGRGVNGSSGEDKSNTKKFVNLFWKLIYKQSFSEKVGEEIKRDVQDLLIKSDLEKPEWATQKHALLELL